VQVETPGHGADHAAADSIQRRSARSPSGRLRLASSRVWFLPEVQETAQSYAGLTGLAGGTVRRRNRPPRGEQLLDGEGAVWSSQAAISTTASPGFATGASLIGLMHGTTRRRLQKPSTSAASPDRVGHHPFVRMGRERGRADGC
jgi:hypothetical protein